MALDPTQILRNVESSFNTYFEDGVSPSTVNYNEDPFETEELTTWYAIRYTGYETDPVGMGELIEEDSVQSGRFHKIYCEVSAWSKDDPGKVALGEMVDVLVSLLEAASITLYDFTDPEDPQAAGTIYMKPKTGKFTPVWGGGGLVWKTASDQQARSRITGFVLELELRLLAEV